MTLSLGFLVQFAFQSDSDSISTSVYDMCTYTTYTMKVYVQSGAEKKYMCGQVYVRSDEKLGGMYSAVYHSEWLECIKNINKIHLELENSVGRRLRRAQSELSTKNEILKGISKKYIQSIYESPHQVHY